MTLNSDSIFPEEVKQGLYSDFNVAALTTGYFKISKESNIFLIEVQLKKGVENTFEIEEAFRKAIGIYLKPKFRLKLYYYEKFPYGMELDYERKFKHID